MSAELDAVLDACERPVEVVGDSPAAARIRARTVGGEHEGAPATVVETSGTAEGLERALLTVRDLGTVVLAGPAPVGPVSLDLHDQLHVRGITLVGVEPGA
jgi:threonine dehydrogenase-like Zn-dependent dehydrogenase